jgi:putative nucleotidyltransferase with HDIG domain
MTSPFKRIRVKAALFVLFLLVGTTLAFNVLTIRIMNRRILDEVLVRASSLGKTVAAAAGFSSLSQDVLGLDAIVFKIKSSNPDIESIAILDPQGKTLVHNEVGRAGKLFAPLDGPVIREDPEGTRIREVRGPTGPLLEVRSPIVFMGKDLGSVVLSVNKSVLFAAQAEARRTIVLIFVVILVVGVASSIFLTHYLTRPIQELSSGVLELKEGKRSQPLRIYSRDELGRLTMSFNEMMALITTQRNELGKYSRDLEEAYVSTVQVLAAAIDARDHYTLGHSTRVAGLSVRIGEELGLGKNELEDLQIACLFHDVGKIKIPDSILLKKGKLNPAERVEMMKHSEYGAEILGKASSLVRYIPAVRHHHERHDGNGYPGGLRGDEIPLHAGIMAISDVFDAMTSDRPYRDAIQIEHTLKEMRDLAGKHFRPALLDAFLGALKKDPALPWGAGPRTG